MARLFDWIPNKREFLARSSERLGLLTLLDRVAMRRWQTLLILTYHRIATPGLGAGPFYDPVISATPESFRAQLEFLASRFHVIGLDQVLKLESETPEAIQDPTVLITFDDGYRDNFESALPILCELGVPATFFIPTGILNEPRLPWWDHIAFTVKRTDVPRLQLDRYPGDSHPIVMELGEKPSTMQRTLAIVQIIKQFLDRAVPDEPWFLTQLDRQANVNVDTTALWHTICSWIGIR